jgi:hypothetical protein
MFETTTTTKTNSPNLLDAARAGAVHLSEDYDDLFADIERRKPEKGYTIVFRREHAAFCARAATPAGAVAALARVVLGREVSSEGIEAILRAIGAPERPVELPAGLL